MRTPLDEPLKPHGIIRFILILLPCLVFRFMLGDIRFSLYWFVLLYFPMINWSVYWTMGTIRLGINRLAGGQEFIPIAKLRKFYVWYLNMPGSMVLSELVYQAYLFNR